MLSLNILDLASHDLFHMWYNNQDGSWPLSLSNTGNKTIPVQEDVSHGINKNRLNFNFLLSINENELDFCAINHVIMLGANNEVKFAFIRMKTKMCQVAINKL